MARAASYREFAPRQELAPVVACTWERTVGGASRGHVLPDGCVDLVFMGAGRLEVAGPDTGPVRPELPPGSTIVGLRMRPGFAGAALAHPANELRDRRLALEDLWGRPADELTERLAEADGAASRRAILEDAIACALPGIETPDPVVLEAIRELGRSATRVSGVSEAVFVSERHLRRLFHEAVGYGPKTLDRVLRFQRFLSLSPAIATGSENLAGAAARAGYADQAHLSREVRRLSGLSPSRLVQRRPPDG